MLVAGAGLVARGPYGHRQPFCSGTRHPATDLRLRTARPPTLAPSFSWHSRRFDAGRQPPSNLHGTGRMTLRPEVTAASLLLSCLSSSINRPAPSPGGCADPFTSTCRAIHDLDAGTPPISWLCACGSPRARTPHERLIPSPFSSLASGEHISDAPNATPLQVFHDYASHSRPRRPHRSSSSLVPMTLPWLRLPSCGCPALHGREPLPRAARRPPALPRIPTSHLSTTTSLVRTRGGNARLMNMWEGSGVGVPLRRGRGCLPGSRRRTSRLGLRGLRQSLSFSRHRGPHTGALFRPRDLAYAARDEG